MDVCECECVSARVLFVLGIPVTFSANFSVRIKADVTSVRLFVASHALILSS